ncbi:CBS domain-containing protein [Streptomyces sp. M19]
MSERTDKTVHIDGTVREPAAVARRRTRYAPVEGRAAARKVRARLVSLAGLIGGPVLHQAGRRSAASWTWSPACQDPTLSAGHRPGHPHRPPPRFLTADAIGGVRAGAWGCAPPGGPAGLRPPPRRDAARRRRAGPSDRRRPRRARHPRCRPVPGPRTDRVVLVGVDVSLPTLLRRMSPARCRPAPPRTRPGLAGRGPFAERATDGPRRSGCGPPVPRCGDCARGPGRRPGRPRTRRAAAPVRPPSAAPASRPSQPERAAARGRCRSARAPAPRPGPLRTAADAMSPLPVVARPEWTVAEVRAELAGRTRRAGIDAVAVVDDTGRLVADIALLDLAVADGATPLSRLPLQQSDPGALAAVLPEPAAPGTALAEVADRLVADGLASLLVVDDAGRPLGRVLADDVLATLLPGPGHPAVRRLS